MSEFKQYPLAVDSGALQIIVFERGGWWLSLANLPEAYGIGSPMRWFKRFFGPHIVAMSEPYSDGETWLYIFGDEHKFKLRRFQTVEDAYSSYTATLTGLRLGSPEISIKLIKLDTEQARAIARAESSYREIIERHL